MNNDPGNANNILTLVHALRKLSEQDLLQVLDAITCKDFYARCAAIDRMSHEGQQIMAQTIERMTYGKASQSVPDSRPVCLN